MTSRVYVLLDDYGNILRIEGEYTLPEDLTGWILIEEGEPCDRLNLAQTNYLQNGIYVDFNIPRYKFVNGIPKERSQEEINIELEKASKENEITNVSTDDLMLDLLADHEERICMIELVTEQGV